jgi:hypothetical protein
MPTIVDRAFVEVLPLFTGFAEAVRAGVIKGFAGISPVATAEGQKAGLAFSRGMGLGIAAGSGVIGKAAAVGTREAEVVAAASGSRSGLSFLRNFAAGVGKVAGFKSMFSNFGVAAGIIVAIGVKMAGDFQSQMVRLVTAAGESQSALKMVSSGVLAVSRSTGVGTKQLSDAVYLIESAGFHGKKAIDILSAAAQGAKVDLADAGVVANALTTAMVDLGKGAGTPALVMSQLIATVGRGKMTMNDLASALHSVLPNAAALHLSLAQTGGAIATMTAQGISAFQATQNLNHAILSLVNPTKVQTDAMAAFGLNSSIVARDLGKKGLAGTLDEITSAILHHMGPAGLTLTNAFNTSHVAAGKAATAYNALSPALQVYADKIKAGTMGIGALRGSSLGLTLQQRTLLQQWAQLQRRASGFSDLLKAGSPSALTYTAALAKMTGGQQGLQVALHLTGANMPTYLANIMAINAAHVEGGKDVEGWAAKQQTFNQKMSELKQVVLTAMIALGTQLLPVLSKVADFILQKMVPAIGAIGKFMQQYLGPPLRVIFTLLAGAIAIVYKAFASAFGFIEAHQKVFAVLAAAITIILLPAIAKLAVATAVSIGESIALWALYAVEATINAVRVAAAWVISLGPIGWIILAVAGLVAIIILNWKKVSTFVKKYSLEIAAGLTLALGPIGAIIAVVMLLVIHWRGALQIVMTVWNACWKAVAATWSFVSSLFSTISKVFTTLFTNTISAVIKAFEVTWNAVWKAVVVAWNVAASVFSVIGKVFTTLFNVTINAVIKSFEVAWNAVWKAVVVAWGFASSVIAAIGKVFSTVFTVTISAIIKSFETAWNAVWKAVVVAWGYAAPVLSNIGKVFYAIIGGIILLVIKTFQLAWSILWKAVSTTWTTVGLPVFNFIAKTATWLWSTILSVVFASIKLGWSVLMTALKTIWAIGQAVVDAIATAFRWLWSVVLVTVFAAIKLAWNVLMTALRTIWAIGQAVVDAIAVAFRWLWGVVLAVVFAAIRTAWNVLMTALRTIWAIGDAVVRAVAAAFSVMWGALKTIFGLVSAGWNALISAFRSLWNSFGAPLLTAIGTAFNVMWGGIKTVFGLISTAWSGLWNGLKTAFNTIWGGIKSAIHTGIKAVVDVINFFIRGINTILHYLPGGLSIKEITFNAKGGVLPGTKKKYAIGGVLPGYSPGIDNIAIPVHMFSGGEGILVPEATRALGGKKGIDAINAQYSNRISGPPGSFATGGIAPTPVPAPIRKPANPSPYVYAHSAYFETGGGGIFGKIWNAIVRGLRAVANAAVTAAEAPVKAVISHLPKGFLKDLATGAFNKVDGALRSLIGGHADKAKQAIATAAKKTAAITGGNAGANVSAYQSYALSRFAQLGWNSSQLVPLISLWNGESGWNPRANNPSSGAYGIPQSLPADKMASAGADWRTNAATQINWGLSYIKSVYGTPSNAFSQWNARSPHWYKEGAWNIPSDQLAYLHRKEMVIPAAPAEKMRKSITHPQHPQHPTSLPTQVIAKVDEHALARAMQGLEFRFDGDGIARLVSRKQATANVKGYRR